jgi:hypothetical protein
MKKFFALSLLWGSMAFAAGADPRLMGLWHVNEPVYNEDDMKIMLDIELGRTEGKITSICTFPKNVVVRATVTSKVEYTDKIIRPLETKQVVEKGPHGEECTSAVQKIDIYYKFKSDKAMTLSDITGTQKFDLHKD